MHCNAASFAQSFCAGKKRKRVSLAAHPEEDQVKARKLSLCQFVMRSKVLVVLLGGIFCHRVLAFDASDLLGFQRRLGNHRLGGHAEIAIRVVRLYVALVAEEHMHLVPKDEGAQSWIIDEQAVEELGCGTSGQGYVEGALFSYGGRRYFDKFLGAAIRDRGTVRQDSNFGFGLVVDHTIRCYLFMAPALFRFSVAVAELFASSSSSPIFRHARPSRAMSSSASFGPQEPDG